ncbi:MAG: HD domain-containing phosphohydrolase [Dehalococcoidia bacterium]
MFRVIYGIDDHEQIDLLTSGDSRAIETLSNVWSRNTRNHVRALVEQWQLDLDTRDSYSGIHSQLAAQHALALARCARLSSDEVGALWIAGRVYDLGKIALPVDLLTKDGPLNSAEMLVLRSHVSVGHDLLHDWPVLRTSPHWLQDLVLETVLFHHERWDGGGYLGGKHGEQIPLPARIMAIADAYTAMILNSPYRVAREPAQALREIGEKAGTQFDPDLAQQFVHALRLGARHTGVVLGTNHESGQETRRVA